LDGVKPLLLIFKKNKIFQHNQLLLLNNTTCPSFLPRTKGVKKKPRKKKKKKKKRKPK
jgi:hypothetical protein